MNRTSIARSHYDNIEVYKTAAAQQGGDLSEVYEISKDYETTKIVTTNKTVVSTFVAAKSFNF